MVIIQLDSGQLNDVIQNALRTVIAEIPSEKVPAADQLLTIRQAAQILSLSVQTVYGLVSKAELPVCKRGKRLYFSKQELTEWIKAGKKKTRTEIEAEANDYMQTKKRR